MLSKLMLMLMLLLFSISDGKLLTTVWLARHGAREPKTAWNDILIPGGRRFQGHRRLTTVGLRQHYLLGRIFQEMYGDLFNISAGSVAVRSTTYQRTFASGMGFLRGLGPRNESFPILLVTDSDET
jgi:hypothetical protein